MFPFKFLNQNNLMPSEGTSIFEIGCHDGRILMPFYREGYKVAGIDIDEAAISTAKTTMLEGSFVVGDALQANVPDGSFVIIRNVLSFLGTKEKVDRLLMSLKDHHMFFTFFGPNDELAGKRLVWTRQEVEEICMRIGAVIADEFDGMSKNMAGDPRKSHVFTCIK